MDDLKNVGESNYNPGVGTDQRVQSLVFMMMMMKSAHWKSSNELAARPKVRISSLKVKMSYTAGRNADVLQNGKSSAVRVEKTNTRFK